MSTKQDTTRKQSAMPKHVTDRKTTGGTCPCKTCCLPLHCSRAALIRHRSFRQSFCPVVSNTLLLLRGQCRGASYMRSRYPTHMQCILAYVIRTCSVATRSMCFHPPVQLRLQHLETRQAAHRMTWACRFKGTPDASCYPHMSSSTCLMIQVRIQPNLKYILVKANSQA